MWLKVVDMAYPEIGLNELPHKRTGSKIPWWNSLSLTFIDFAPAVIGETRLHVSIIRPVSDNQNSKLHKEQRCSKLTQQSKFTQQKFNLTSAATELRWAEDSSIFISFFEQVHGKRVSSEVKFDLQSVRSGVQCGRLTYAADVTRRWKGCHHLPFS